MDHLLHYIKKEVGYGTASGTIYLDLPKDAKISTLMLELRGTVGATHDNTNSMMHCIEKVHVLLDGAKVAYSMQPEVASFDYFLRAGMHPPHELSSRPTAYDFVRLPLMFGRFPGDKEYGLDTARYGSASVEIEYTMTTTDYETDSLTLTAWILVPAVPVSYKGFIRTRIIEDKVTPTGSAVHTVNFPSTYPLLTACFRVFDADVYPYANVTDLDFQADQGRVRIFDGRMEDLFYLNDMILGADIHGVRVTHSVKDGDAPISFMSMMRSWDLALFCASDVEITSTSWKGPDYKISSSLGTAVRSIFVRGIGRMPYGCLILGDWRDAPFNAPAHADLKCDFTVGTAPEVITTYVNEVVEGTL